LDKTFQLLDCWHNPQLNYSSVLIGGTNGKGSVSKFLAEILKTAGYKTGLYTSPHLVDIRERIVIDGHLIPDKAFSGKIRELQKMLEGFPAHMPPTFFESLTAIAFSYFADEKVDIVISEVGMGGRFDATNVLPSFMEIITPIGLEHTKYLGKTYEEIAFEKAGIIKRKSIVISAAQNKKVTRLLKRKVKDRDSKMLTYGRDFNVVRKEKSLQGQTFHFYGHKNYKDLRIALLGRHQIQNAALAVQAALLMKNRGFECTEEDIRRGLETAQWPCRFQLLCEKPLILIDGAHNPDGIKSLRAGLQDMFPAQKFAFMMGILKDKNYAEMLSKIIPAADRIVFTAPETSRACDPKILAAFARSKGKQKIKIIQNVGDAINYIRRTNQNWCICGSLYLCGDVLRQWNQDE
jgi:dihydrofolate synthase / folylpolyglutamate synthase